jgi:hypothetical protein
MDEEEKENKCVKDTIGQVDSLYPFFFVVTTASDIALWRQKPRPQYFFPEQLKFK